VARRVHQYRTTGKDGGASQGCGESLRVDQLVNLLKERTEMLCLVPLAMKFGTKNRF